MPMSAERRGDSETLTDPGKFLLVTPTADAEVTQLTVRDRIVRVTSSAYTNTIVLPPVAEANGLDFHISCDSATKDVTITDFPSGFGDSIDWTDLTLTAAEDAVTLLSNGRTWIIVENKAT